MTDKPGRRSPYASGLLVVVVFSNLALWSACGKAPGSGAISPAKALALALASAAGGGPVGGLGGQVTSAHGRVTTYQEALRFVLGATEPGQDDPERREQPVWLIVLGGEFVEHVPAVPGIGDSQDVSHQQMAVILDARTGDTIQTIMISPQQELAVDALQALPLPRR